jgi:hypothetical protein
MTYLRRTLEIDGLKHVALRRRRSLRGKYRVAAAFVKLQKSPTCTGLADTPPCGTGTGLAYAARTMAK